MTDKMPHKMTAAERNARVVARLEALTAKQRLRRAARRSGRLETDAQREKIAAMEAKGAALRKRESLPAQARTLALSISFASLHTRRRSLRAEMAGAQTRRMLRDIGGTCDALPPRTERTGTTIRALDRAESLLLRLVVRGVEREASEQRL